MRSFSLKDKKLESVFLYRISYNRHGREGTNLIFFFIIIKNAVDYLDGYACVSIVLAFMKDLISIRWH